MLYLLLSPLAEQIQIFNLLNYLTFRTGAAMMTAFALALAIGNPFIAWLKTKGSQPIRSDGPESHIVAKAGTPTMGGFIILAGILAGTLIWGDISNPYLWVVIFVTAGFGGIGFIDDWRKVTKKSSDGLSGKGKLVLQFAVAGVAVVWMTYLLSNAPDVPQGFATSVAVPFMKDLLIPLSYGFYLFGMVVIVGASNAVNLTDGLDGLAIVPVMMAAACFGLIALREFRGLEWVLWLILLVVATDVAGYFAGKTFGGPKFWPSLSPKKTWSGTSAGWVAAFLVGLLFGGLWLGLISVVLSFASQLGDISESAVKRRAGVKDSSNLIPGHGGLLDRFDGLMAAALVMLVISTLIGLPQQPG